MFVTSSKKHMETEKRAAKRLEGYVDRIIKQNLKPNIFYISDPLGNLMMSYPADINPKGILKDLKKLLRASRIG